MIHSYHHIQSLCSLQLGLPFPTRLGSMPSSDGVRHTRGAVFSMDQLIIAGAFRLWSTARGVTSIHAGSHQTTQPTRAGNIAAGVKPADPRGRLARRRTSPSEPTRTRLPRHARITTTPPTTLTPSDKLQAGQLHELDTSSGRASYGQAQAGPPGLATRRDREPRRHNQGWQGEGEEQL